MKELTHLKEIFENYDNFIIDLWGVIHNGIKPFPDAIKVVENLKLNKKKITFLSNAPRPNENVQKFLRKIKIKDNFLSLVLTSGEIARMYLKKKKHNDKFFHLGPIRDRILFQDIKLNEAKIDESNFIICTGLFDNKENDLIFYENLLKKYTNKEFICTNPDLIVNRGTEIEYCAGKIAEIFTGLGGKVKYFGKPYPEVYKLCVSENEKTLVIGDNLNTDIKGANLQKVDSLLIINGIHKNELKKKNEFNYIFKKYGSKPNFYQKELIW